MLLTLRLSCAHRSNSTTQFDDGGFVVILFMRNVRKGQQHGETATNINLIINIIIIIITVIKAIIKIILIKIISIVGANNRASFLTTS